MALSNRRTQCRRRPDHGPPEFYVLLPASQHAQRNPIQHIALWDWMESQKSSSLALDRFHVSPALILQKNPHLDSCESSEYQRQQSPRHRCESDSWDWVLIRCRLYLTWPASDVPDLLWNRW